MLFIHILLPYAWQKCPEQLVTWVKWSCWLHAVCTTGTTYRAQTQYRVFYRFTPVMSQHYRSKSVKYNLFMPPDVAVSWLVACCVWEHRFIIYYALLSQKTEKTVVFVSFWVTPCCSLTPCGLYSSASSSFLVFPRSQCINILCHAHSFCYSMLSK